MAQSGAAEAAPLQGIFVKQNGTAEAASFQGSETERGLKPCRFNAQRRLRRANLLGDFALLVLFVSDNTIDPVWDSAYRLVEMAHLQLAEKTKG